jgi:DNA-binding HxlR family transcriptional regulator
MAGVTRTPFHDVACSLARSFAVLGDAWAALILRDVSVGITRFDALQRDLGLSRKVLTERLGALVEGGVLERRPYQDNPPRHDYVLTAKGEDLVVALLALLAWGDRWEGGGDGPPVVLAHEPCGHDTVPQVTCSECGLPLQLAAVRPRAGPGARPGPRTRQVGAALARLDDH